MIHDKQERGLAVPQSMHAFASDRMLFLPSAYRNVPLMQVDNRMRAWYMKNMSVGLLYNCSLGDLRPDAPVALLQNRRHEGVDFMEVVPMEHQLPAQRDQVSHQSSVALLPDS